MMDKNNGEKRKVFLDDLPRDNRNFIDWKNSKKYKIKFIYDGIEGYFIIKDYISINQILVIEYDNKEYNIKTSNFKRGQLGVVLGKLSSEFKIEVGTRFQENKRDITIIGRKIIPKYKGDGTLRQSVKYYKYKCNLCGFDCGEHYRNGEYKDEMWIEESHLLTRKDNCSCCSPSPQIVVEKINSIVTTTPWMVKYFQGGYDEAKKYCKTSNQSIYPICPDCGRIRTQKINISDIYRRQSIKCLCSDEVKYPNKFAFKMLEELKIDFEAEYNPEWIKPRLYDFYFELNDKEYILEMDGGFHNNDNKMNGQSKEESQFIDNEKDRLAKEHNIKVIRIDCNYESVETRFNYIRNSVLNDKNLNKLFDLSNINFNKCNEFACSNLVKTACEYKRNNPDIKTTEISNILKKAVSTIIRWLKIGNELGWCYYNAREELLKVVPLNGKSTGKQVEIFKDHISLGIFESCHELERCSEELFRVKLNVNGISRVCRGERKSHKGYTFKYI